MSSTSAIGSLPALMVILVVAACSHHDNETVSRTPSVPDPRTLFEPTGLTEVRDFADLPSGVKKLEDSYMKSMKDGNHPKFLAGGANESNIIAAYEEFGFVPSFHAEAYVKTSTGWVFAKGWDNIGEVQDLRGLLIATKNASQ